jgi:hypothetical protein
VSVYTGHPATVAAGPNWLGTRWISAFTNACTATPSPTPFAVTAERPGPPPVAPSSQVYWVVASDENLNFLAKATTYRIETITGGVVPTYGGDAQYADALGFSYRYWPCDGAGNCASQCRATANLPCVMTPAIGSYSCGLAVPTTITGGTEAEPGLLNRVDWVASTPWQVYGNAKVGLVRRALTGTNN